MRAYRRLRVRLPKRHRDKLDAVLKGGVQPVRVVLRALSLLQLHDGQSASAVAAHVRLSSKAVREIGRRYQDAGWERSSACEVKRMAGVFHSFAPSHSTSATQSISTPTSRGRRAASTVARAGGRSGK